MGRLIQVASEVSGSVWRVLATPGHRVERDAALLILESMKMEIPLESPVADTVREVFYAEGDEVTEGAVLVVVEAD